MSNITNKNAAGIDISSKEHVVAVPKGRDSQHVRTFQGFTRDLHILAKWLKSCRIGDQLCYISGCKVKGRNGKNDFLIIASFNKPDQAQLFYEQRWQIETCFKAMKSSGFDIEKTHLSEFLRLQNLILLVMLAFVWCYKVGIFLHYNMNKIKVKKHGRKAVSLFKHGLKYIASTLLNLNNHDCIGIEKFLSCT